MDTPLLALYGSLMSVFRTQDRLGIRSALELQGLCEIPGSLYDLGDYPGLLEAQNPQQRVHAELYLISDTQVLQELDSFEGYQPDKQEASLFIRKKILLSRPQELAWVYIYNGSVIESELIESSSWIQHLADRKIRKND